ncbi:Ig-like domain-containing protein [Planococcus halotolerans]|uniref:Ig-like domain-containing protein n=1 Tax=Planococcus halotolerans TaxID=2233542 RepID=UPI001403BA00|nr:Ig-like domain-containing protein [Planococcus halotolerans]
MIKKILAGSILLVIILVAAVLMMTREKDSTAPEVQGVEKDLYNEPVTPTFNEGTAELNGDGFSSGTAISEDGVYTLEVTDDNGNTAVKEFTIDQTAPEKPAVGGVDNQTEMIEGSAEANSKVKVWSDEELLAVGMSGDDGNFSLPVETPPAGSTVFIAAIDPAGNQSAMTKAEVSDVTAPNAPEVAEVSDRQDQIEGQSESGSTVFIYAGDDKLAETEAEEGKFSAPVENLEAGKELTLHAVDDAGNKSEAVTVTVKDRTAPDAPEVNAVTEESTAISGKAEPGAAIRVFAGNEKIGETTVNDNGEFKVEIARQTSGTELEVIAIDEAGNESEARIVKVGSSQGQGSGSAVEPTYIDGILVVNKKYGLPPSYAPGVNQTAQSALNRMLADAEKAGHELSVISSYRSYSYQEELYNRYVNTHGEEQAKRFAALPGHSEHQTGLAFDLGGTESQDDWLSGSFGDTPAGKWLAENAHKYGFIVRYPKGKEAITGYIYEPWHFRYLGVDTATDVYNSGLTLEEYLGVSGR